MKKLLTLAFAASVAFSATEVLAAKGKTKPLLWSGKMTPIKSEKYPDGALFVARYMIDLTRLEEKLSDAQAKKLLREALEGLSMPENLVICLENGSKCYDKVSYNVALGMAEAVLDLDKEATPALRELIKEASPEEKGKFQVLLQNGNKVREIATYWVTTLKSAGSR